MLTYWGLMETMRNKGWQIDRAKLVDPGQCGAHHSVTRPQGDARTAGCTPRCRGSQPGNGSRRPAVADLKFVDIDRIKPTRPKDYGMSEPVVPRDAKSNATLEWEAEALARVEKAPGFVQPMIIKNAEAAARANGSNFVTVKLLDELQARQGGVCLRAERQCRKTMNGESRESGTGMANGKELAGKVVIITGGTMGIGFGMATRLAKYGASVVITSRSSDSGEAALIRLREAAGCAPGSVAYVPDGYHQRSR